MTTPTGNERIDAIIAQGDKLAQQARAAAQAGDSETAQRCRDEFDRIYTEMLEALK